MINTLIESLSLIEDMVSEVIILRNSFYLRSMTISKNIALLLIQYYSRNITIYVLSKYLRLL